MIPVVPPNLPNHEFRQLTISALIQLQSQSYQVFESVNEQMETVQNRIDQLAKKVNTVKTTFQTASPQPNSQQDVSYEIQQHLPINDDSWDCLPMFDVHSGHLIAKQDRLDDLLLQLEKDLQSDVSFDRKDRSKKVKSNFNKIIGEDTSIVKVQHVERQQKIVDYNNDELSIETKKRINEGEKCGHQSQFNDQLSHNILQEQDNFNQERGDWNDEVLTDDENLELCRQQTTDNNSVVVQQSQNAPSCRSSLQGQNLPEIGLESADIYNFFLREGEKVLNRIPSCLRKPQHMESLTSLFWGGELFKTTSSFNGPYIRVTHDQQPGPSSQVCSAKRTPSVGLSSITQSSLLSNLSTTRSQQLKARRDARRRKFSARTPPPPQVSSLLRQVQTQVSAQRQCFSREDTNTVDSIYTSSSALPDEGGEEDVEQVTRKGSSFRLPNLTDADKLDSIGLMWAYDVSKNKDTNSVTVETNR